MDKELKTFAVTWDSNIEASTPLEAARECWRLMRGADSTANCFTVTDEQGNVTEVDLMEEGAGNTIDRDAARDKLWEHVETSIEGYANMIDRLIAFMPEEILAEFLQQFTDDEDPE